MCLRTGHSRYVLMTIWRVISLRLFVACLLEMGIMVVDIRQAGMDGKRG